MLDSDVARWRIFSRVEKLIFATPASCRPPTRSAQSLSSAVSLRQKRPLALFGQALPFLRVRQQDSVSPRRPTERRTISAASSGCAERSRAARPSLQITSLSSHFMLTAPFSADYCSPAPAACASCAPTRRACTFCRAACASGSRAASGTVRRRPQWSRHPRRLSPRGCPARPAAAEFVHHRAEDGAVYLIQSQLVHALAWQSPPAPHQG